MELISAPVIALALRTERIPILPAMFPDWSHIPHDESFISFCNVYDLSAVVERYDLPIVEMMELKVGESWYMHDRFHTVVYDGEMPQRQSSWFGTGRPLEIGDIVVSEAPKKDDLKCWNAYLTLESDPGGQISLIDPIGQ